VGYWVFQKVDGPGANKGKKMDVAGEWGKKKIIREGGGRNNFCILL